MMGIKRDFIGMFDVMKGILMLVVLMIHHIAFNQAVLPSGMVDMLSQATRYGVTAIALFFMVSGYTLSREENWRGYAKRQARQLLVPYFVMMVICVGLRAFFALCMGRFRIQVISPVALAFLYGSNTPFELFGEIWVTSVVAFWFLPVLFFGGVLRQLLWRIGNTALQALCLIACALLGLLVGWLLHMFIVGRVNSGWMMFGKVVAPLSYLWAFLITIGFAIVVYAFMLIKLYKIIQRTHCVHLWQEAAYNAAF